MKHLSYRNRERVILKRVLYLMILVHVVAELMLRYCAQNTLVLEGLLTLFSTLSLAFIASYIFYYVVVVIKERRDAKNIHPIISLWLKQMIGRGSSIVSLLEEAAERSTSRDWKKISQQEFEDLCMAANPNKVSKRLLSLDQKSNGSTYGQLVYSNSVQNVNSLIDRIFVYMPYLGSELTALISKLKQSAFHLAADMLVKEIGNKDFSAFSKHMFEYLQMLKDIAEYHDSEILLLTDNQIKP